MDNNGLSTSLLDIEQASDLLAVKKSTLYSWIFRRKIPHIKVGRLVRFEPHELTKWLKANSVEANES